MRSEPCGCSNSPNGYDYCPEHRPGYYRGRSAETLHFAMLRLAHDVAWNAADPLREAAKYQDWANRGHPHAESCRATASAIRMAYAGRLKGGRGDFESDVDMDEVSEERAA